MDVKLLAVTEPVAKSTSVESLLEHAGRICYRSKTGDNPGKFVRSRVREGHESIIEHGSATFQINGISRTCSHQLVRHRLASFSQESQRYCNYEQSLKDLERAYRESSEGVEFLSLLHGMFVIPESVPIGLFKTVAVEAARAYIEAIESGCKPEDARFMLPTSTRTRLVMTANFREWLHIFRLRISPHAQWEIRDVCLGMFTELYPYAPSVFGLVLENAQSFRSDVLENVGEG
jgi:thymidylate synthase (FAD)